MGEAQDRHYYDQIYEASVAYTKSHVEAVWAPLWKFIASYVKPVDRVLDLGCGPGHLAAALVDAGVEPENYVGVDFSAVAIGQAAARVPKATFLQMRMPDCIERLLLRYLPDVITFCEILEHLGHDHDQISIHLLPVGLKIISTVPNFNDPSHVRTFDGPAAVVARYGKMLDIEKLDWITQNHLGFVARRRLTFTVDEQHLLPKFHN